MGEESLISLPSPHPYTYLPIPLPNRLTAPKPTRSYLGSSDRVGSWVDGREEDGEEVCLIPFYLLHLFTINIPTTRHYQPGLTSGYKRFPLPPCSCLAGGYRGDKERGMG